MGLFTSDDKKTEKGAAPVPAQDLRPAVPADLGRILRHPRITERAVIGHEKGVYVFDVAPDANKKQIEAAVRALYKVEPRKVNIVTLPYKRKRNARTGQYGMAGGGKKAYVYLKEGETISVM